MKYYYPDNLEAPPMWFFWTLRDTAVISLALVLAVLTTAFLHVIFLLAVVLVYAFVTMRFYGVSISDYLAKTWRYLLIGQQIYFWRLEAKHESVR